MCVTSANRQADSPVFYFSCRERTQRIRPEPVCSAARSLRMDALEGCIVQQLCAAAGSISDYAVQEVEAPKSPRLLELERLLSELERLGNNPALESSKAALRLEVSQIAAGERFDRSGTEAARETLESAFSDPTVWRSLKDDEKRAVFRDLIQSVTVDYAEVEIGLTRAGLTKYRIDWTIDLEFAPKLGLPAMTALLPIVPKSNCRKLTGNS